MSEQLQLPLPEEPLTQVEFEALPKPNGKGYADHAQYYAEARDEAIQQKEGLESQLEAAKYDSLTGMRNRNAFNEEYPNIFERSKPGKLAIIYVDIANTKPMNDKHGHSAGDKLIQTVSSALKRSTRPGDIWYRIGGDEMVGVVDGSQSDLSEPFRSEAKIIVDRIKENSRLDIADSDLPKDIFTGVGVGQAVKDSYVTAEELYELADKRMEVDKRKLYEDAGVDRRS